MPAVPSLKVGEFLSRAQLRHFLLVTSNLLGKAEAERGGKREDVRFN